MGLPTKVGAGATGERGDSLGTNSGMKAWGHTASEFREGTEAHVDTDQVGLPQSDDAGPVLEEGQSSGVFYVHVHASGGGKIRPMIKAPIIGADAAGQGLIEGKVGLDPGDPRKLLSVSKNGSPEVTMLPRRHGLGV